MLIVQFGLPTLFLKVVITITPMAHRNVYAVRTSTKQSYSSDIVLVLVVVSFANQTITYKTCFLHPKELLIRGQASEPVFLVGEPAPPWLT
jgi:hypothetical protein